MNPNPIVQPAPCSRARPALAARIAQALLSAAAVLSATVTLTCAAQSPDQDADTMSADPPGRVGRLSLLAGTATLTDTSSGASQAALVNWPITGGQNVRTDAGSRAEIQIGSLAVRLDGATDVEFVRVDDDSVELVVQRGSVALHMRSRDMLAALDLTTPRERIVLDDVGRYRLDVDRVPGLTSLTVGAGYARVLTDRAAFSVTGGQRADLSGEPVPRVQILAALADTFDDWVAPLDRRDDAVRSARYVSTETTGIESLDDYGQWSTVPEYGQIWFPGYVQAGWVPYRFGRWAWVVPWGWTWVDEAPWGFAPFHYGRWVYLNGLWGWLPGARSARPVYAPCLVAWYGAGAAVGWFLLGPGDVYVPGYRASRRYVETLNVPVVRRNGDAVRGDSQPRYVYQRNPNVVTWVDPDTMAHHRPVGRSLQTPPSQWNAAPATHLAPVPAPPPRGIKRRAEEPTDAASPASRSIQPSHGQTDRPARLAPAPAAGFAPSPLPAARRPPSPMAPAIGGEPGWRGQPATRPVAGAATAVPRPAVPVRAAAPPVAAPAGAPPPFAALPVRPAEPARAPPVRAPPAAPVERAPAIEPDRGRTPAR